MIKKHTLWNCFVIRKHFGGCGALLNENIGTRGKKEERELESVVSAEISQRLN